MSRRRHRRAHTTEVASINQNSHETLTVKETDLSDVFSWESFFTKAIVLMFHLLLITTPFFFTWVNEELFEFNKMLLVYALSASIGGLWLGKIIITKKLNLKPNPLNIPLTLFLISQLLSTIFSIHPYTSIFGYYTRFHGGLLSTLSYYLLFFAFINNVEKKHLRGLFVSTFAAALGVCLYALPEHFGRSPSCLLILANNEAAANGWDIFWSKFMSQPGQFLNVDCWVQDVQNRVFGTFGQPNWLAAYTATLIPVGVALGLKQRRQLKIKLSHYLSPVFYVITTILLFVILLFTKSRSGILGLGVGLAIFMTGFIWLWWRNRQLDNSVAKSPSPISYLALLTIIVSFFATSLIFGTPFTPTLKELSLKISTPKNETVKTPTPAASENNTPTPPVNRLEVGGTDSGEIRKIVWEGAVKIWQRYPILGSGVETFAYSYYRDRPMAHNHVSEWDFLYNKAHNEFLNYLATTGIIGLGTYGLLLAWFWLLTVYFLLSKSTKLKFQDQVLLLSMGAGVIGLSISNFFGFSTVMVTVLMYLFMAIMVVISSESIATPTLAKQNPTLKLSTSDWLSLSILSLVIIYVLFIILNWWKADYLYNQGENYSKAGQLVEAAQLLEKAAQKSPNEALFYDKLSDVYGQLAVALAQNNDASLAAQVIPEAIKSSDLTLKLNPVHLNFYKSRAHLFILLAQLNPKYLDEAVTTLRQAQQLAPTDPKIVYNLALILNEQNQTEEGVSLLEQTIEMKPNYDAARFSLGQQYEKSGQPELAKLQYRYILENINPNSDNVKARLNNLETLKTGTDSAPINR